MKPTIIVGCGSGYHNEDLEAAQELLKDAKQYQDLYTVILTPTRGMIPAKVVQSWMFLIGPANAQIGRMFCQGLEVAAAYNSGVTTFLNDPMMGNARYILTLEDDNIPPHDGLLKLYESICDCEAPCREHFVVVSGLYWMKGEGGQPMLFGDPDSDPMTFVPQIPKLGKDKKGTIQECNGTGMGFALFHSGLFRLEEFPKPWFETKQVGDERDVVKGYTQDLYFMENLRKLGYRVAVDTRVKVGHYDWNTEQVW